MTKQAGDGPWRAVALPHNYPDGTTHRWAVQYTCNEGMTVQIADWLDKSSANLICAAPDMLAALQHVRQWLGSDLFSENDVYHGRCEQSLSLIRAAITKATGGGNG